MVKPNFSRTLIAILLSCQCLAGSLLAAEPTPGSKLSVSQTRPEEAGDPLRDPLHLWFVEQDKLLDDILVRLSRIEYLVKEIHRLIVALPVIAAPSASLGDPPSDTAASAPHSAASMTTAAISPPPAPPAPGIAVAPVISIATPAAVKSAPSGVFGFFERWGTELAGIGLLALVLMIGARHRRAKQIKPADKPSATPAKPSTVTPATLASPATLATPATREPAFLDDADENLPAPPSRQAPAARHKTASRVPESVSTAAPANTPAPAPKPVHAEKATPPSMAAKEDSGIQRAGATGPSKGQADQALELAEIMLSMGLGHGAAQTLTEQIRSEPKDALSHWLKLLQIYRSSGQQDEFEKSAEELRLHFNVQPEDWQARAEALRSLEDYPHIATRLTELWDRPASLVYLNNLLSDNRGGARSGFPLSVAEEMLLLSAMLKAYGVVPEADSEMG